MHTGQQIDIIKFKAKFCLINACITAGLYMYTDSQKHESTLLHVYVLNQSLIADRYVQTNIFEKTLLKVCSSHLSASFGTFCVQIDQLFEAQ